MNKLFTFYCDCKFHKIEIEEFTIEKEKDTLLSICIYQHKSFNTGKLLKKPKLLGDVVLDYEDTKKFKQILK